MFPCFYNRNKYDVRQACIDAGFSLSPLFLELRDHEIKEIWNGIGASGKWYNFFIPKTAWGLNINLPSCPHDIDYAFGRTNKDKKNADLRYRKNNVIWVKKWTKWKWLRFLRIKRVRKYYYAVKLGGRKSFWKGKR